MLGLLAIQELGLLGMARRSLLKKFTVNFFSERGLAGRAFFVSIRLALGFWQTNLEKNMVAWYNSKISVWYLCCGICFYLRCFLNKFAGHSGKADKLLWNGLFCA